MGIRKDVSIKSRKRSVRNVEIYRERTFAWQAWLSRAGSSRRANLRERRMRWIESCQINLIDLGEIVWKEQLLVAIRVHSISQPVNEAPGVRNIENERAGRSDARARRMPRQL